MKRIAFLRFWLLAFVVGLFSLPALLMGLINQELIGADSLSLGTPFIFDIHSDKPIIGVTTPDSVEGFVIIENRMQKGKSAQYWRLQIVPLMTGALSFPRLQVRYAKNAGEADSTDAFRVHVLSTLAEGDTLLRDLKPMQRYHFQPPFWLYLLLALLALLLGIMLLVKYLKARKKRAKKASPVAAIPAPIVVPSKQIPAWQIALDELEALLGEKLLEKEELVLFHFRLSEIMRRFLERSYSFPALEMTVGEIAVHFGQRRVNRSAELSSFLSYCDLVKFAKVAPAYSIIQSHIDWFTGYLDSFRIKVNGEERA